LLSKTAKGPPKVDIATSERQVGARRYPMGAGAKESATPRASTASAKRSWPGRLRKVAKREIAFPWAGEKPSAGRN